MGRLIDEDDVKKMISDTFEKEKDVINSFWKMGTLMDKVDEIQTAYDVDAVVEQLEEVLSLADKEKERCARENPLQFDSAKGYATGIFNALEIVKAGGVNA